jgi:hypothetical protein
MLQQEIVNRKLFETGATLTQICAIGGLSVGKVSPWLCCTKNLSNENVAKLNETLDSVAALIALVAPIPLDLRNVAIIKDLLVKMENGELDYLKRANDVAADPRNAEAIEQLKKVQS